MCLLVDMGNTRIKWRLEGGASGVFTHASEGLAADLHAAWGALEPPRNVVLASVASEALNAALTTFVARQWPGVQVVMLRSQRECCGVRIQYAQPENFGIDRFAALIAARAEFKGVPVVVMDAGSALTVDALDATGLHVGGMIMPGLHMLTSSLRNDAARLGAFAQSTRSPNTLIALQSETQAAIEAGVATMLLGGAYSALTTALCAVGEEAQIILTGGDAVWLMAKDRASSTGCRLHGAHLRTELVLNGLSYLSEADASSQ